MAKVRRAWVQYISREGKGPTDKSKQTLSCMSGSLFLLCFPRVFLSFSVTLLHSLSITIRHLITQSPPSPPLSVTAQTKQGQKAGETGNMLIAH